MARIPQACGGWAETQAAYRFLAQEDIEWEAILMPHWRSAEARMRAHPVVLCPQDTTELDFNGQRIAELAARLPDTQLVYVADREADIVALTFGVSPI